VPGTRIPGCCGAGDGGLQPAGMERALRNRLTFGPIMLAGLFLLLWVDNAAEEWTHDWNVAQHPQWNARHPENPINRGVAGTGLLVLLLLVLPAATTELAVLFTAERVGPYPVISAIGSGALAVHAFCMQFPRFREVATSSLAFVIVFVMIAAALRRAWDRQTHEAIVRMAGTVLATLYLGGLAWFLMAIRVKHSTRFTGSTMLVLMILLVVKSTDIGAYFGGRALGRHKLILWLSPGKTWEGLAGGVLVAGLVGAGCAYWVAQHEAIPRTSLTPGEPDEAGCRGERQRCTDSRLRWRAGCDR
jgi:CDP-diglyceride synthetase